MDAIELANSTGNSRIDECLRAFITLIEAVFPRRMPDAQGEFFGYERGGMPAPDGWNGPGTKKFINAVSMAAGALVAIQSDHTVVRRADCASMYRAYVHDEWSDFVEQVCALRTPQAGYAIPADDDARRRLHGLCAQMPAFENHVLNRCKDYLLAQLSGADSAQRLWAIQQLAAIHYP